MNKLVFLAFLGLTFSQVFCLPAQQETPGETSTDEAKPEEEKYIAPKL